MRTLFGMILGCLLTIALLYLHDTAATSSVANGSTVPQASTQIVNWDAAAHEWDRMKDGVRTAWARLTNNIG
jgi:hypothetical protein